MVIKHPSTRCRRRLFLVTGVLGLPWSRLAPHASEMSVEPCRGLTALTWELGRLSGIWWAAV